MSSGTWAVIAATLAAIFGGVGFAVYRWARLQVRWQSYRGLYYSGPVRPELLVQCLDTTVRLLSTRWSVGAVSTALRGLRVYVHPTPTFAHDGRQVAGVQFEGGIAIGSDLAAFLHECAHLCEQRLEGRTDYEHTGWASNGIRQAEAAFHAWLAGRTL